MNNYEVNVVVSAREHTDYLREAIEEETEHEFYLEVEVFQSKNYPDRQRVEFLLACGGPTVRVIVDQYDNVTFYHSWGGDGRTECDLWGDDRDLWLQQAESYVECY